MKKILPILLILLVLSSCIKDDIDSCPGKMYFHFSFIYGGTNRFFDVENEDLSMHFYHLGSPTKYRDIDVNRQEIGIQTPLVIEKTPDDTDSLEVVLWSKDKELAYTGGSDTPFGEGYVRLKEITEGSGICRPVTDLFYSRTKFDTEDRFRRNDVVLPFERAVCRIKITLVPQSVQGSNLSREIPVLPTPEAYTFHIEGTSNTIYDDNRTQGEKVILQPDCYYNPDSGNILTEWFGAFSSGGDYLKITVYLHGEQVAFFDCTPFEIASVPGNHLDLVIDGKYVTPVMEVSVNGWKVASVHSNL